MVTAGWLTPTLLDHSCLYTEQQELHAPCRQPDPWKHPNIWFQHFPQVWPSVRHDGACTVYIGVERYGAK